MDITKLLWMILKTFVTLTLVAAILFLIYIFNGWIGLRNLAVVTGFFVAIVAMFSPLWVPYMWRVLSEEKKFVDTVELGAEKINIKFEQPFERLTAEGTRKLTNDWTPLHDLMGAWAEEYGGLRWVGFWFIYQIYRYPFSWTDLHKTKPIQLASGAYAEPGIVEVWETPTGDYAVSHSMMLDYIYTTRLTRYYEEAKGLEIKEFMTVDVLYTIGVKVHDPILALFGNQGFLEITHTRLKASIRAYARSKTYAELLDRQETTIGKDDVVLQYKGYEPAPGQPIHAGEKPTLYDYIYQYVGVEIVWLTFEAIVAPAVYDEHATLRAAAERDYEIRVINAKADKEEQKIHGEGEAARLAAVLGVINNDSTGNAMRLKQLETLTDISADGAPQFFFAGENSPAQVLIQAPAPKQTGFGGGRSGHQPAQPPQPEPRPQQLPTPQPQPQPRQAQQPKPKSDKPPGGKGGKS